MYKQNPYVPSPASLAGAAVAPTENGGGISEEGGPASDATAGPSRLAGRFSRLAAVIIDGLIGLVLMLPLYWHFHFWQDIRTGVRPTPWISAMFAAVGFAVFAVINFLFLQQRGQTIGKRCVGVKIVGLDGTRKSAVHLLAYRFVPAMLFPAVPYLGTLFGLADALAIFGRERRCLHDRIAGTKVIRETA